MSQLYRCPPEHRPDLGPCWLWQRWTDRSGYGRFGITHGQSVRAHRFAYELAVSPIPKGLCVLHHCDNPPCVRPDHLFLGTRPDNSADMVSKGRAVAGPAARANRVKTHCPQGHPYDEANTRYGEGRRHCKTCVKQKNKRWYEASRTQ